MLTRSRTEGGYSLAKHSQAELSMKEVNILLDLARMYALGVTAEEVQIQRFITVIPAAGTSDVTFTTTIDQVRVVGGYAIVSGLDAAYDFDIGKTGDLDCFINDFNAGGYGDATKKLALDPTYLQDADDVILTINTNDNTGPVTVEIVLLCMHDVQFVPTLTLDADRVLTKLDSGTVFFMSATSETIQITFPLVQEGLNFRFIIDEDTPTNTITIGAGSTIIYGNLEQQSDTNEDNRVICAGVTNVIIGTSALKGDYLDFVCDGTSWYVSGMSSIQTAISTS